MENVDMLHPRNVITRCLGPDQNVNIDIEGPFHVQPGDRFVICSDGLTGHVSDNEIGAIANSMPPSEAARLLINLANCRGGADNVTVIVASIEKFPTIHGSFIDAAKKPPETPVKEASHKTKSILSQVSLILFLTLGTIGLGMLALDRVPLGLLLICPALIIGFIRMIFVTSQKAEKEAASPSFTLAKTAEMTMPKENAPAISSPYRTTSAAIAPEFVEFLAQAQSELTQAARENGWDVDFNALSDLNRKAVDARKNKKTEQSIRMRAKAIDQLMKEPYSNTRRG